MMLISINTKVSDIKMIASFFHVYNYFFVWRQTDKIVNLPTKVVQSSFFNTFYICLKIPIAQTLATN